MSELTKGVLVPPLTFPARTPEQKAAIDAAWMTADDEIRAEALRLRGERGDEYNAIGTMGDYFPHWRSLLEMILLKLKRTENDLAAGKEPKDIPDLINYTTYLGALWKIGWWIEPQGELRFEELLKRWRWELDEGRDQMSGRQQEVRQAFIDELEAALG